MNQPNIETNKLKKIKLDFKDSKYATGRRKKSVAKVWIKKGSGNIHVNGLKMDEYFKRPVHQIIVKRPLEISEVTTNYDIKCSVKGGGLSGQAGAIILGISKALIYHDENLKKNLKKDKLTTRDSRVVERKNTVIEKLEEVSSFLKDNHLNLTIIKDGDIRLYVFKNKINIAIIETGYTGLDLNLILSKHQRVNIQNLCATKNLGKNINYFDNRIKKNLPKVSSIKKIKWSKLDLVFLSLPNGEAQKLINKVYYKNKKLKFIDLSADFRILNSKIYQKNYKIKHKANNLINESIYSIPEFTQKKIKDYRIIANPGCYPTSIQIPLLPLLKKNLIKTKNITIDSKSGYSGAGKNLEKNLHIKTYILPFLLITLKITDTFAKLIKK